MPLLSIPGVVEGRLDEAVLKRLFQHVDADVWPIYRKGGRGAVQSRITAYNNAARFRPWIVLVDLNNDYECAPDLKVKWLPQPAVYMCFRVAVREIEAWLLADRERIAEFLSVTVSHIPTHPEGLKDPKQVLIGIAQKSRSGAIRKEIIPQVMGGREEGPAYTSRLIEFVSDISAGWRPERACNKSDSLQRTLLALKGLINRWPYAGSRD